MASSAILRRSRLGRRHPRAPCSTFPNSKKSDGSYEPQQPTTPHPRRRIRPRPARPRQRPGRLHHHRHRLRPANDGRRPPPPPLRLRLPRCAARCLHLRIQIPPQIRSLRPPRHLAPPHHRQRLSHETPQHHRQKETPIDELLPTFDWRGHHTQKIPPVTSPKPASNNPKPAPWSAPAIDQSSPTPTAQS